MSRYIDADALITDLNKGLWGKDWDKVLAEAIINEAPSIDIVRCKECKHYEDGRCGSDEMWGSIFGNTTECEYMSRYDDDFCSYGERREP